MSSASKIGYEKTVSAINNSVNAATAGFEKTQAQVKQNMDKVMKTAEEFVSFSQGNYEAFVKSSQIWVAGVQDISKQMAATAQAQFEETVAAMKSFGAVKSLKEIFDMQASLARSSMEKAMTESGRLTDASIKLAEQAMAPLTARVNVVVEKFTKTV
jgi:phasin family protein